MTWLLVAIGGALGSVARYGAYRLWPMGASGWPVALDYRDNERRRRIALGDASGGGALHIKLFHPLDEHYGFPPLEAALMALDTHNAAGRWNKALLDNSARPSGALVYAPKEGGNLSDEQYERLKAELEDGYSGTTRAGEGRGESMVKTLRSR